MAASASDAGPGRDQPAPDGADFRQRVWQVLHGIPTGRVSSYGVLAALAGKPGAARQVARILAQLPAGTRLPWQRVVRSDGRPGLPPDSDGYREQCQRLRAEGVRFRGQRVDMRRHRWP